jgi:hypothetical protein
MLQKDEHQSRSTYQQGVYVNCALLSAMPNETIMHQAKLTDTTLLHTTLLHTTLLYMLCRLTRQLMYMYADMRKSAELERQHAKQVKQSNFPFPEGRACP